MDMRTLVAFHGKLLEADKASCEFDDADQVTLRYLFKVLNEMQDLKEIRGSLRRRVIELEQEVAQFKSQLKVLRRAIVTAGLTDPFSAEALGRSEEPAEDITQKNAAADPSTSFSLLPQIDDDDEGRA